MASRLGARPSTSLVASPRLVASLAARPRLVRSPPPWSRHASAASGRDARHRRPRARDGRRASSSSGHLDRRRAAGPDGLRDARTVERSEGRRRPFGSAFGLAAVALGKFKYVLVALKLTKLAPVLSMVASSLPQRHLRTCVWMRHGRPHLHPRVRAHPRDALLRAAVQPDALHPLWER